MSDLQEGDVGESPGGGSQADTVQKALGSVDDQKQLAESTLSKQQTESDGENESIQNPKLLGKSTSSGSSSGYGGSGHGVANGLGQTLQPAIGTGGNGEHGGLKSLHGEAAEGQGVASASKVGSRQMAIDAEAASLQQAGSSKAAQQVRVDEESAALQQPQALEKVKQAGMDDENAQLQSQGRNTSSGGMAKAGNNPAEVAAINEQSPPSKEVCLLNCILLPTSIRDWCLDTE